MPTPGDLCKEFHWEAAGPGFTEEEYAVMFANYEANLNIRGTGAIIAAPDAETPGGDYRCGAAAAATSKYTIFREAPSPCRKFPL